MINHDSGGKRASAPRLLFRLALGLCTLLLFALQPVLAMLGSTDHSGPPKFIAEQFNLPTPRASWSNANGVNVRLVSSNVPANVLFPDTVPTFTFDIRNNNDADITLTGTLETRQYMLVTSESDFFSYEIKNLGVVDTLQTPLDIPAHGSQRVTLSPKIPAKFGGYAMIFDLGAYGRHLSGLCIRTFASASKPEQFPVMTLDDNHDRAFLDRIGIHAVRLGSNYCPTTGDEFQRYMANLRRDCADLKAHNVTAMLNFNGGTGETSSINKLVGGMAHELNAAGEMTGGYNNVMWDPSFDPDFAKSVEAVCSEFGWPKGPITAVCLFNEPWEGGGISGWMSDMPRYRDAYKAMADGVLAARKNAGVQVLVGGCDSTSNALDKLFGDGSTDFLPIFDYVSVHYQGLDSRAILPMWQERKGPLGRVRIWDTESWVANTDDRIAPMLASWRAAGYDRLMGVDASATSEGSLGMRCPGSPAAAVSAMSHFLGSRPFNSFLFKNGLPWVMVFDGMPDDNGKTNVEDGTVVVAGDLGVGDNTIFRTVTSLKVAAEKDKLRQQLQALPADSLDRTALLTKLSSHVPMAGASMTLVSNDAYALYDFYGNPQPAVDGKIVIPLNPNGFFLRGNGKAGSFKLLLDALRHAHIDGLEPVEIVAHDMIAPIGKGAAVRLSITNVMNRPVTGVVSATLGRLKLAKTAQTITIAPDSTLQVPLTVVAGEAVPSNTYPLSVTFSAGKDGLVNHQEDMHCNVIAHKTITVDGNLDDWQGVLPQPVSAVGEAPSLTEQAWYPNKTFSEGTKSGFATGYLAYDSKYLYFAAKVADNTPNQGTLRYATLKDDDFFYPDSFVVVNNGNKKTVNWPAEAGTRHFLYRKEPILPSGNGQGATDNIQLAFNVIPENDVADKGAYSCPIGTMPHYTPFKDTDYEYALNLVAPVYGGGTEIWRLNAPGMPRKSFYPRQPKSPLDGAVNNGKLVIRRDGDTRITECAIPWSEIPWVKKALDAGKPIKFTYRVNDDNGPGYELTQNRSVAQTNCMTFHVDWVTHWSNEDEFGFAK